MTGAVGLFAVLLSMTFCPFLILLARNWRAYAILTFVTAAVVFVPAFLFFRPPQNEAFDEFCRAIRCTPFWAPLFFPSWLIFASCAAIRVAALVARSSHHDQQG